MQYNILVLDPYQEETAKVIWQHGFPIHRQMYYGRRSFKTLVNEETSKMLELVPSRIKRPIQWGSVSGSAVTSTYCSPGRLEFYTQHLPQATPNSLSLWFQKALTLLVSVGSFSHV